MQKKLIFYLSVLLIAQSVAPVFAQKSETDSLLALLPGLKDTSLVNQLNAIAVLFTKKGDDESTLKYASQALKEAEKAGFKRGIGTAYRNLGVYHKNINDYKTAITYYKKAIAVNESDNDLRSASAGHHNIANIYVNLGEYQKAIESYLIALKMKDKVGDKKGTASTLNGMAGVYYMMGDHTRAEDYFRKSLNIRIELKDESGMAQVLNNIGGIYQVKQDHEKAVEHFMKALEIQQRLGEKRGIPNTLVHLGGSYFDQQKYSEGLKVFTEAFAMYEQINDKIGQATVCNNVGNIYSRLGDFDKAEQWLLRGLGFSDVMQVKDLRRELFASLAEVYRNKKDYKKAFEYQEKQMKVKDTLLNESTSKAITDANTKYETERKELQISSLEKDNAISNYEINKQKNFKYTFMIFSALIVILAFVLLRGYNSKKKANLLLAEQKEEIEFQKAIVDEKNKDITDSIIYAKRIQDAILPSSSSVAKLLPQSFILFKPKDIVSGDFYWVEEKEGKQMFAAVDCTGHGVPGALMSIVGHNLLNQAVNEQNITSPAAILDSLNNGVSKTLQQKEEDSSVKDGMDIALCTLDKTNSVLEFAGAFNSLYFVRDGLLKEIKGDKFPVGIFVGEEMHRFTNKRVDVQKGDTIYIFTDGFADQFGGAKGKKFKYKQLQEKILSLQTLSMQEQGTALADILEKWKGALEQVDDVLVIGVRI